MTNRLERAAASMASIPVETLCLLPWIPAAFFVGMALGSGAIGKISGDRDKKEAAKNAAPASTQGPLWEIRIDALEARIRQLEGAANVHRRNEGNAVPFECGDKLGAGGIECGIRGEHVGGALLNGPEFVAKECRAHYGQCGANDKCDARPGRAEKSRGLERNGSEERKNHGANPRTNADFCEGFHHFP